MKTNRLKEIRRQRGLTQPQLTQRTAVPAPRLSCIESGRWNPKKEEMEKIARALRVPADKIWSEEG